MFSDVCQRTSTSTHIIIVVDGLHVVVKRLTRLLVQLRLNSLLMQLCQLLLLLDAFCLKCLVRLLEPLHHQARTTCLTDDNIQAMSFLSHTVALISIHTSLDQPDNYAARDHKLKM